MPQDRLRSAVYRSFVTCDDPKGVVECKTVRKSKIDSPNMEKKVVKQRTSNHLYVSSSSDKEEKREYSSSSLQLMEVSREAQKLNQVIDSWSKDMSFEKHSKDIAKDLLKGALDLQESLVMLGKLQEASQHMAKLKKQQKDKSVKSELDGIGIERTKSQRILDDHKFNRLEFQKPRFSVDGASRDCFDELREVIRDSFARQNLLPPSCASEKSHFDRRKVELSPDLPFTSFTSSSDSSYEKACVGRRKMVMPSDIPSTSSSQSSVVQSQEVTSFDYSLPKIQQEKREGPNLIARLMGLEGIPRKPQHSTTQKHLENDRVVKQRRPVFEIDLPKAKKPPCIAQKVDAKRRTLDEIIETMHLQGLLRSKSMDKSNHGTHQSSVSGLLQKFVDDSTPIVIMKPLYTPDLQAERFSPCIHEDKPSGTRNTIGKWDVKEENSPENSDRQKGASNFTTYRKLQTRKDQNTRFSKEKVCKDHGEVPANSKTLEVLIQEKQPNTKTRASSPCKPRQPKKEAIEKRVERTQRVAPPMRKSKQMTNAKLNDSAKLQDQSKLSNMKVRKPERKPLVAQAKSTVSEPISKRITTTVSHNSSMRKKNVKTDKSIKSSAIPTADNTERKDEKVKVVHLVEEDTDVTKTKVTSSEELHFEEVVDISENLVIDNIANGESFSCEATVPSIHCASDIKLIEHTNCNISIDFTEKENFNSRATSRYLLLSSESFLCRAEELFETDAWEPTVWQTTNVDHEIADSTLLLDCANELLENKRSRCALAVDPLSRKAIKIPKNSISFDKLVNEICDGIEVLRNYNKVTETCDGIEVLRTCNKVAGKTLSVDTLYALLERDLWCKGVVSSAWDLGWRLGFTNNEVEQVVTDIERYLLTGVIDDLLTEFRL